MNENIDFDYCAYITRNGVMRCDDVMFDEDSFKGQNANDIIPLVYNWDFGRDDQILGLAFLEHRTEGIYAKLSFNNDEIGQSVKDYLLNNLDRYGISFTANQIELDGNLVKSGVIEYVHITPIKYIHTYKEDV